MSQFNNQRADNLKIFSLNFSDINGRLDPLYYYSVNNLEIVNKTIYPIKKLSQVIDMQRGRFGHRPRNEPKLYGGEYPFIQTGDIVRASQSNGKITYSQTLNELGLKTSRLFDTPVVVITIAANIGDTAILDYPACFPDSLIGMTPKTNKLTLQYINLYFKFIKSYLEDLAPQSAQKNINYQQLSPVPIVVAPLETQHQAVALYEKALNENQQKQQQATALLASIDTYLLTELGITLPEQDNSLEKRMFRVSSRKLSGGRFDAFYNKNSHTEIYNCLLKSHYPATKLKLISESVVNGKEFRDYFDNGYRYLRVTDLEKHGISNKHLRYIRLDKFPESIRLTDRDILISRSGSLGLVSCVVDEIRNSVLSSHIFKVSLLTDKILPNYLEIYLRSTLGQFQFFQKNNGGVIPEINQSALKDTLVILPSISKQREIAEHIQAIRTQAKQLQQEAEQILRNAKAHIEQMILGQ